MNHTKYTWSKHTNEKTDWKKEFTKISLGYLPSLKMMLQIKLKAWKEMCLTHRNPRKRECPRFHETNQTSKQRKLPERKDVT